MTMSIELPTPLNARLMGFDRLQSPSAVYSADKRDSKEWTPVPRLPSGEFDLARAGRWLRIVP